MTPTAHEAQRGCVHGGRTESWPKACHRSRSALGLLQHAGKVCAGSPAVSMSEVTAGPGSGWHLLLQVCRREQRCSWPGRQPFPFPAGAGQVCSSWLAEPMSVPASLYRCPHHSAGEGRVNWRYQLCCWGMQFPGSFCTHQGISACSFNEETISRDSSSKPNLASSPCRYELNQLCCHATI